MWHDMMALDMPVLEKVLRTILVYLAILFILRFAGKRLMAQMNALDLVVVLLLSNVVQNAIIGEDNTVLGGVIGAVTLVAFNALMDRLAQRYDWAKWLFEGRRTDLVVNGAIQEREVAHVGLREQELRDALSVQGVDDVATVERASLEPGGEVVVHLRDADQPVTRADLERAIATLTAVVQAVPER